MTDTIRTTYRFRLRDKHSSELDRQARAVNLVWNYCNEVQQKAASYRRPWPSAFGLMRLTAGSGKILGLHAHTVQGVCKQYARSRDQRRMPWLRFRGRKSLGWVPFNTGHVKLAERRFVFRGNEFTPMHWRDIPAGCKIGAGSFNRDARGKWFINLTVEVPKRKAANSASVGIDLGLKDIASLSDGRKIAAQKHYRNMEDRLRSAQRAGKRRLALNIHSRIKNSRRDHLHKVSAELAVNYDFIAIGDVSPSKLARTNLSKSIMDAGWSDFKNMLRYKAIRHNGVVIEVNERMTTQTCSQCGCLPPERPRGIAGLGIREWECSQCGTVHDRDVNAAKNILRIGLDTLAEGASQ